MLLMTKCLGLTVLWITLIANLPTIDSGSRTEPTARPLPVWYDEAKFGVMIHWGLFSVPSYGGGGASEWFWKHWKDYHLKPLVDYMSSNYKPGFSYADFAEQFTAELYNPDEWVDMISKSGAKYVVMTSKHHEGFCNWPTNVSFSWRSVDVGPHRDLLGDFAKAVREKSSMKLGIYHSLYEWFNPLYLTDKANKFTTNLFSMGKTIPELYELVNTYKPSLLWSDGEWEATADYWNSTMFINWLYNQSPVKDEVVVNNRWGANGTGPPGDYKSIENQERIIYKQKSKWENAVPIDSKSWGFRRDAPLSDYLSSQKLIRLLVQAVSMGGNFLMNIGPTADGRIPMIFQERLRDIGAWLTVNGEAIYSTTVWSVCQIDRLNSNVWYTQRDSVVYGTVIETWPSNSTLVVSCPIVTANTSISLLGAGPVTYTRGAGFIAIHLPPYPSSLKSAWTFKFTDLSNAE